MSERLPLRARSTRRTQTSRAALLLAAVAGLALAAWVVARPSPPGAQGSGRGPATSQTPVPVRLTPAPGDTGVVVEGILRVADVDATAEGWAILEGSTGPATLVDAAGRVTGPVGRAGQGPGELSMAAYVAHRQGAVAILDFAGTALHVFLDGHPPVRLSVGGCTPSLADDLAATDGGWLVLRRCLGRARTHAELLRVDTDGTVTSLGEEELAAGGVGDPFLRPLLAVARSAWLGTNRSECLRGVAPGGDSLCFEAVDPVPVPEDARQHLEGPLAARARSVGMRISVPEYLPPLLGVRAAPSGWATLRVRPSGDEVWVLETPGRAPAELVPETDVRVEPGPAGILLLRQDPEALRAWVVPVPSAPLPPAGGGLP